MPYGDGNSGMQMVVGHLENNMVNSRGSIKCLCISKVPCCPEEGVECFLVETGEKTFQPLQFLEPVVSSFSGRAALSCQARSSCRLEPLQSSWGLSQKSASGWQFLGTACLGSWVLCIFLVLQLLTPITWFASLDAELSQPLPEFPVTERNSLLEEFPVTEELTSLGDLSSFSVNSLCA